MANAEIKAGTDVLQARPAILKGEAIPIGDFFAVLDAAEAFPDDTVARVFHDLSETGDAVWGHGWSALILEVHDASIVAPIIGRWPLDVGMSDAAFDAAVTPATCVAALRRIATIVAPPRRLGAAQNDRFVQNDAFCERFGNLSIAYMQANDPEMHAEHRIGDLLIADVGMAEDGLPFVTLDIDDEPRDIQMPRELVETIVHDQPICMNCIPDAAPIGRLSRPTVLLHPILDDGQTTTLELALQDPLTVMRIMRELDGMIRIAA